MYEPDFPLQGQSGFLEIPNVQDHLGHPALSRSTYQVKTRCNGRRLNRGCSKFG